MDPVLAPLSRQDNELLSLTRLKDWSLAILALVPGQGWQPWISFPLDCLHGLGVDLVGLLVHLMVCSTGSLGFLELAQQQPDGSWYWLRVRNSDKIREHSLYRWRGDLQSERAISFGDINPREPGMTDPADGSDLFPRPPRPPYNLIPKLIQSSGPFVHDAHAFRAALVARDGTGVFAGGPEELCEGLHLVNPSNSEYLLAHIWRHRGFLTGDRIEDWACIESIFSQELGVLVELECHHAVEKSLCAAIRCPNFGLLSLDRPAPEFDSEAGGRLTEDSLEKRFFSEDSPLDAWAGQRSTVFVIPFLDPSRYVVDHGIYRHDGRPALRYPQMGGGRERWPPNALFDWHLGASTLRAFGSQPAWGFCRDSFVSQLAEGTRRTRRTVAAGSPSSSSSERSSSEGSSSDMSI